MPGQDPAGHLQRAVRAAASSQSVAATSVAEAQRRANEAEARLMAQQVPATTPPREEGSE